MRAASSSAEGARLRILNRRAEWSQAIQRAINAPDLMLRSGDRSGKSIGSSIALCLPLLDASCSFLIDSPRNNDRAAAQDCQLLQRLSRIRTLLA
jgi:hypothetical protein